LAKWRCAAIPADYAYRNVYVFKFEVVDDQIRVITCYANPVIFISTFPDLAAAQFHGGLVVLHDDADYELAERHLPDVRARRVVSADE
jgi:hypothetical protein